MYCRSEGKDTRCKAQGFRSLCFVPCALCLVSFLFISSVYPAYGAFEGVELGARPLGMGSAFTATADGAGAIFWNPAGIARVDGRELTMSYMELYSLVSYSSVGYAQRLPILSHTDGAMGFGLVSSSDVDGIYRETILAVSAAGEVYHNLSAGANVKYLSSAANTGDVKIGGGRGLSLDMGCQYRMWEGLISFGITFQNLVGYVSYNREALRDIPGQKYSQRPDFSYKIGAGIDLDRLLSRVSSIRRTQGHKLPPLAKVHKFPPLAKVHKLPPLAKVHKLPPLAKVHKLPPLAKGGQGGFDKEAVLAIDLSDGDVHIGAECIFWDMIAARAGFRTGNALTRSITAGFGVKLSALRLDYAYVGSEVGSQTSQFSISINW